MNHLERDFHFSDFSHLDSSPDADYLAKAMDVMASLADIQAIKAEAISHMGLQPGDSVLEVGCGHGDDAEAIGKIVGDQGRVVAVDVSQHMLEEAKRRSTQPHVEYRLSNARELGFPDRIFSGCHADRFLLDEPDYRSLFKDSIRFVKPGGAVCFTDVDALSIILAPFDDTTSIILDCMHESFTHPHMGRDLPPLFADQGLEKITVLSNLSMMRSFSLVSKLFPFPRIAQSAVNKGLLTPHEVEAWFAKMHLAEQQGAFLYCITFITVVGKVPTPQ